MILKKTKMNMKNILYLKNMHVKKDKTSTASVVYFNVTPYVPVLLCTRPFMYHFETLRVQHPGLKINTRILAKCE